MDENEKIVVGGANHGNNSNTPPTPPTPPSSGIPMDDEFQVPTERVALPSKGLFYPNKKSFVEIKYMTAEEDNILFSSDLIKSGKVLDVLLESVIKDKIINVLGADNVAILAVGPADLDVSFKLDVTDAVAPFATNSETASLSTDFGDDEDDEDEY